MTFPLIWAESGKDKVLLLNSYHKGFRWSDEITRGVEDSLKTGQAELYIEYMDTKRLFHESYLDHLSQLYEDKYAETTFDLVITSDNNAFDFFRQRGKELFGDVPQIFCGYNYLKPSDLRGMDRVTGINEQADLEGNLNLIMSLHGDTRKIIILTENTVSGKRVQEEYRRIRDRAPPGLPELELYFDTTRDELIQWARDLPEKTVVLMTFFSVDRVGETYGTEEIASLLKQYSSVPVYGSWDFTFGYGIVGGFLIEGYDQGFRAGSMALQVLNGTPVKAIPVEYDTPQHLKFDYRQLERFEIPLSRLPPEGEIDFRPRTFYSRYRQAIWIGLAIFTFQSLVILYLISLNRSKKRIQNQLAEQKDLLKQVINHIPHRIYWKDRDLYFLGCNIAFAQAAGTAESEIIGVKAPFAETEEEETLLSGLPLLDREEKHPGSDGAARWIQKSRIPIEGPEGKAVGVLGIDTDITERKNDQLIVETAERKLRATMDSIEEGVISTDWEGRIVQMNRRAEILTGVPRKEGEGGSCADILPLTRNSGKPVFPVDEVLREERRNRIFGNLLFQDPRGKEYILALSCSPIRDGSENIRGAVMVFRDITEEKMIQKQLIHTEKMDTLGQLAGGITHDFNNMLGGIMSSAQLIKPYLRTDEKAAGYLDILISTVRKAGDLTKELLLFSRKSDASTAPFEITREINQTMNLLGRILDKHITINTSQKGENCLVNGDPSRIQSALMNLGINASHAMPGGGTIDVVTDIIDLDEDFCRRSPFDLKPGRYFRILFADTGTGIPDAYLGRIFEPFFTTKEEGKGTGLGLSTVFRTVEQHGGSIEVESREGEGTAFTLCLPLISGEVLSEEESPGESLNGVAQILLVDDDPVMRVTGEEILKHLGYGVALADDGEDGLEYYRSHWKSIDLVILDMIMPKMNGRDCYMAMREINPAIRAILTSGFTTTEDVRRLKEEGLAYFCRKPYTIAQLGSVIEKAMKQE